MIHLHYNLINTNEGKQMRITNMGIESKLTYMSGQTGIQWYFRAGGKGQPHMATGLTKEGAQYLIYANTKPILADKLDTFMDGYRAQGINK